MKDGESCRAAVEIMDLEIREMAMESIIASIILDVNFCRRNPFVTYTPHRVASHGRHAKAIVRCTAKRKTLS
jgi:hypothetical protein